MHLELQLILLVHYSEATMKINIFELALVLLYYTFWVCKATNKSTLVCPIKCDKNNTKASPNNVLLYGRPGEYVPITIKFIELHALCCEGKLIKWIA